MLLGFTSEELWDLTPREFMEAVHTYEEAQKRLDRRAALVAWSNFKAVGGKEYRGKIADFMPSDPARPRKPRMTVEEDLAHTIACNRALGGKDLRRG